MRYELICVVERWTIFPPHVHKKFWRKIVIFHIGTLLVSAVLRRRREEKERENNRVEGGEKAKEKEKEKEGGIKRDERREKKI